MKIAIIPGVVSEDMSQAAADVLVEEANALFRAEKFAEAVERFERATALFPPHALAWRGLGHALLCLGRPHEAASAFDRAIGHKPDSATALWGGAVAHAETGNRVVAQSYLKRALVLQPTWVEMARGVPALAQFLQLSTRTTDVLRGIFGSFSTRSFVHAGGDDASPTPTSTRLRAMEVGRIPNQPAYGKWTFVTVGLSNREWSTTLPTFGVTPSKQRPRIELVMASTVDGDAPGQILANLAFHLSATNFFPEPGVMVRDVVATLGDGDLSRRLPHVYLGVPRLWPVKLPLDMGPPAITLAQVMPVSEAEYDMWRGNHAGFEATLLARKIDVSDLRRHG